MNRSGGGVWVRVSRFLRRAGGRLGARRRRAPVTYDRRQLLMAGSHPVVVLRHGSDKPRDPETDSLNVER